MTDARRKAPEAYTIDGLTDTGAVGGSGPMWLEDPLADDDAELEGSWIDEPASGDVHVAPPRTGGALLRRRSAATVALGAGVGVVLGLAGAAAIRAASVGAGADLPPSVARSTPAGARPLAPGRRRVAPAGARVASHHMRAARGWRAARQAHVVSSLRDRSAPSNGELPVAAAAEPAPVQPPGALAEFGFER
jgi:hypothetical protein